MEIMDFRLNSTFYLRPILHTFPWKFQVCDVKINILRDRFLFYTEEATIFEVILSICSEFYQIGTPHFSLEGVRGKKKLGHDLFKISLYLANISL